MRWPSGLERGLGLATGRSRPGSNPAAENLSLRNFGNSIYPALQVFFGGDTKSRWSVIVSAPSVYVGRNLWICDIHGSACAIYGSIVCAEIHGYLRNYGFCVGCKSFHYSNPSLAQTNYIDRLATSTNLYNRRNRITDCRRRNSVEHSVAACSCRKITIIRHVRFVPG